MLPSMRALLRSLLLHRSYPHIDLIRCRNQNGFRKGRSTLSQILVFRKIIEKLKNVKAKDASNSWFAIQTDARKRQLGAHQPIQSA